MQVRLMTAGSDIMNISENNFTTEKKVEAIGDTVSPESEEFQLEQSQDSLRKAVDQANKVLADTGRHFEYEVHEATNSILIRVIDNETKEVIREIPPKKLLDAVVKLWELAGIFVDKKA